MKEVDYLEMCYLSIYWSEYTEFRQENLGIKAYQYFLGAIQAGLCILTAGVLSYTFHPKAFAKNYPTKLNYWTSGFAKEVIEEVFIEEAVSSVLYSCGVNSFLANWFGEALGDICPWFPHFWI